MPDWLRIALFLSTISLLFAGLGLHVSKRVREAFGLGRRAQRLMLGIVALGVVATLVSRTMGSQFPEGARALGAVAAIITLSLMITSVLLWPYELSRAVHRSGTALMRLLGRRERGRVPQDEDDKSEVEPNVSTGPSRRDFVLQASVLSATSVGVGSALYGTLLGRHDFTVEDVPVALAKLPRTLDGFRILQLSDIHVGLFVGEYELGRALELVQREKPDAVVLTGDLVDHDPRNAPVLGRFVRRLSETARHGVFAIPGNHDYYAGISDVLLALREGGAEVLQNRHLQIGDAGGSFVLAGVDDVVGQRYGGPGPNLSGAFDGANPDLLRVLLSHNPSFYPSASTQADLVLSGHTHGGQITLFINPAELVLRHGYVRGLYENGASQLYVNRGFGTAGPPARVGSAPEITRLTLTRA